VSQFRSVDVDTVIRSSLARAGTLTRDHRVALEIDDGLPLLGVDPASVTEAIYILVDNASKYSPVGTTISLKATLHDDRHVRIIVTDEGPGIPKALRERVFEKFFRVPTRESHDPRRGGVGLGLPIGRRLVETQAGRIWIDTPASGRGTAVMMTLPIAIETSEVEKAAVASR
jgi:two-component system sensor histidine kinase KdpD